MATFTILNAPAAAAAGSSSLCVIACGSGWITYNTDSTLTNWASYQITPDDGTISGNNSIAYGLDSSGNPLWGIARGSDNYELLSSSDPTAGAASWTAHDTVVGGGWAAGSLRKNVIVYRPQWNKWVATRGSENEIFQSADGDISSAWSYVSTHLQDHIGVGAVDGSGTLKLTNWRSGIKPQLITVADTSLANSSSHAGIGGEVDGKITSVAYGNGVWKAATSKGSTYKIGSVVTTNKVNKLQYGGGDVWMGVGNGNLLLVSTNNGSAWSESSIQLAGSSNLRDLAKVGNDWIAIGSDRNSDNIFKSSDDGATWTAVGLTGSNSLDIAQNVILPNT